MSVSWKLRLPDSETSRQRGDDIRSGRHEERRVERAKEEEGWNTSYRVVWSMATGSINLSILPTHLLLLFTAPQTFLKTNLEKRKLPFSVAAGAEGIPEQWIMRSKMPKLQRCWCFQPSSRTNSINILTSALDLLQKHIRYNEDQNACRAVLCTSIMDLCCVASGFYFPEKTEPKCLHYSGIKGHSIQECNRLKFHTSEVYLKVGKEFKKVGDGHSRHPDSTTVHSTLS